MCIPYADFWCMWWCLNPTLQYIYLRTALEHEDWQHKTTTIRIFSESFLPVIFY